MLVLVLYVVLSITTSLAYTEHPSLNMFIFGDSMFEFRSKSSDHQSWMKAGYLPYGAECMFIGHDRFTNGRTIPEFLALSLELNPIISIDELMGVPDCGINFASASAGILPQTGTAFGKNLCLKEQISQFREYVHKDLTKLYQTQEEMSKYLWNSIYLINIGTSDYIHNYLQSNYYNTSKLYGGEEFAELLIKEYGNYLEDLYKLGARKMVIFQIGPLGCLPYILEKLEPRSRCAENINTLVSTFNKKLDIKLQELSHKLQDSKIVTARIFPLIRSMIQNPADYGFEETRWPCCATQKNGTGLCEESVFRVVSEAELQKSRGSPEEVAWLSQKEMTCKDIPMPDSLKKSKNWTGKPKDNKICGYRKLYLFFDQLHMTDAAYRIIADRCLAGSDGTCSPYGLTQLAGL